MQRRRPGGAANTAAQAATARSCGLRGVPIPNSFRIIRPGYAPRESRSASPCPPVPAAGSASLRRSRTRGRSCVRTARVSGVTADDRDDCATVVAVLLETAALLCASCGTSSLEPAPVTITAAELRMSAAHAAASSTGCRAGQRHLNHARTDCCLQHQRSLPGMRRRAFTAGLRGFTTKSMSCPTQQCASTGCRSGRTRLM